MKFKASCENTAKYRRNQIRARLYKSGLITLYEVKKMFGETTDESDHDFGWGKVVALERKIRVRETKKGWFLYLPEPSKMTWDGENMHTKGSNTVDQVEVDENGFTIKHSNPTEKFIELLKENDKKTDDYAEKEIEAINGVTRALGLMNVVIRTRLEKLMNMIGANNGYFYRPCVVKAKKSGLKEERQDRQAWFHRWADLSKGVQQVVAIVEFDDGHVEQVRPDRVVFSVNLNSPSDFVFNSIKEVVKDD